MHTTTEPLLLSPAEVGRYLGCSEDTVRRMVRQGKLKAIRSGRNFKIPRSEIDKLGGTSPDITALVREIVREELRRMLA